MTIHLLGRHWYLKLLCTISTYMQFLPHGHIIGGHAVSVENNPTCTDLERCISRVFYMHVFHFQKCKTSCDFQSNSVGIGSTNSDHLFYESVRMYQTSAASINAGNVSIGIRRYLVALDDNSKNNFINASAKESPLQHILITIIIFFKWDEN